MPDSLLILGAATGSTRQFHPDVRPQPGDILVCHANRLARVPGRLLEALSLAPWCPLVLAIEGQLLVYEVAALLPVLPRKAAVLQVGAHMDTARIRDVVSSRPPPDASDILNYLSQRDLPRGLLAAVEDTLDPREGRSAGARAASRAIESRRSASSLNRRLAAFGPLRCRDWRALLALLSIVGPGCAAPLERQALAHGRDPRTLRAWLTHLLGGAADGAVVWPGWEWKLEVVLRRFGYVDEARTSRPVSKP